MGINLLFIDLSQNKYYINTRKKIGSLPKNKIYIVDESSSMILLIQNKLLWNLDYFIVGKYRNNWMKCGKYLKYFRTISLNI